jgi:acetate kinase
MFLIVEPNINEMNVYVFYHDRKSRFACFKKAIDENTTQETLSEFILSITESKPIDSISFRILFGGNGEESPVLINESFINGLKDYYHLYPFYLPTIEKIISIFYEIYRDIPLFAFYETSFFHSLPEEERLYALPSDYTEKADIKRYGFHGIFHKFHADQFLEGKRIISIIFDKQTTVCSLLSGKPMSINFGITQLEGIMGRTSCGDIDAGIIFYLMRRYNFSIYKIDNILKRQSGFYGLTGLNMGIKEMFKLYGKDKKVTLAFDIYKNHILKYIGECLSVLEGADAVIIGGNFVQFLKPFIFSILKHMSFLGINLSDPPWENSGEITEITSPGSEVKVFIDNLHVSEIIHKETERIMDSKYSLNTV